jgi:hypothetical protein
LTKTPRGRWATRGLGWRRRIGPKRWRGDAGRSVGFAVHSTGWKPILRLLFLRVFLRVLCASAFRFLFLSLANPKHPNPKSRDRNTRSESKSPAKAPASACLTRQAGLRIKSLVPGLRSYHRFPPHPSADVFCQKLTNLLVRGLTIGVPSRVTLFATLPPDARFPHGAR